MSEIVNTATIKVVADASGVEAGLRPVDEAVAKTGKNLDNLGATAQKTGKVIEDIGKTAGSGLDGVGDSAGAAATKVDRATKTMADSIQRAIQAQSALAAGAKGTAENYAALAQARGINTEALKPLLAQLSDVRTKADLAAEAQRKLDDSTKFIDSLRARTEGIGKSASELAQLRAAQLGVSEAAAPMIAKLREAEQAGESAFGKLGDMAGKFKGILLGIAAGATAAGLAFGALVNNAINDLGELDDMAQKTGSSVESLSKIQKVVSVFGPDMGAVNGALDKLSKGMATVDDDTNKTQKALAALGVSAKDSSNKLRDPSEVLVDVAKALQNYNDGAAKTALIMDLVGKSGADLLPFMNDLAENYDKVSSVSADAASAAAGFQDELGWMKLRFKELFTTIAIDALPALSDLAGAFLDVYNGQTDLSKPDTKRWADDLGLGIAQAADAATMLGRSLAIIWNSVKAVRADISLISTIQENANPFKAGYKAMTGGSPTADIKKALAERNKVVADADKQLDEMLARPTNQFEAAFLARMKARGQDAASESSDAPKKTLNYTTGNDPAAKEAEAAAKKEAAAYATVTAAIQSKIEENRLEVAVGQAASESQKLQIKVDQEVASGKLKLSDSHKATVQAKLAELAASEQLVKAQQAEKDSMAWMRQSAQARNTANDSLAAEYQLYGQSADARALATVSIKAEADLEKFLADERRKGINIGEELEAQLRAEKDMRVEVEQATLAQTKALGYANQLSDQNKKFAAASISDPRAREQALLDIDADVWRERIRLAGEGTQAQKILQEEFDTWYANRMKGVISNVDLTQARDALDIMSALNDAARNAAQGMADSFGSVGSAIGKLTTSLSEYGQTQAAIAFQLASATKDAGGDPAKIQRANVAAAQASAQAQIKSYGDMAGAAKGFFRENTAGYKVMSGIEKAYRAAEMALALETMAKKIFFKETEVAANTTLNATKLSGEAAASAASTGLAATEASAWGITAVVKAIASMPFPLNLAAGAATLAAVVAIGAKMFGSVGSSVSLSEQRQTAQGAGTVLGSSTGKSESISRAIELSASNSSTQINYLSGMLTSLRAIETNIGSFASQLVQTTDVSNPDVHLNSSNGLGKSIASWGLGGIVVGSLLSKIPVLGKIFDSVGTSIFGGKQSVSDSGFTMDKESLASLLATGANARTYADIKTDGGWFRGDKTDTKNTDLGAEANRQFTAIIASMADGIQSAGELLGISGAGFEAQLNSFVVDIGKVSLKGLSGDDLQKALESVFSKLGDQMASYAIGGLTQFQKVGEGYLETLVRVASDYANVDASLQSIGKTFGTIGVESIGARESLIALLGGIDDFQSKTASFASNFLTKAEQLAPVAKYVDEQMAALGLAAITTRDQFKGVVLSLDLTTAAGQKEYAALMDLQEAFAATHAATVDLSKTEQEIADEKKDLQDQLDQLTMTQAQLAAKARYALAEVNRPLYDLIQTAQKLADTSSSLTTFRDAAKSLYDSLSTSSLSILTPEQQEAELHSQYEAIKAAAMGGDTTAQGKFSEALNAWLATSQKLNSGDSTYQANFAEGQRDAAAAATWASNQIDAAQAQLAAMNSQTGELQGLNTALNAANTILQTIAQNTAPVTGPASVIGNALSALGTAIKAVENQVAGLRKDQTTQTGDTIAANAEGQQAIVDSVNKGTSKTTTTVEKVTLE